MATTCAKSNDLSQREREIIRELARKIRRIQEDQQRVDDLTPLGAQILKGSGGRIKLGNTILELDHIERLIYSAEVDAMSRKLQALKAKERAQGLVTSDPPLPTIKLSSGT